MTHFQMEGRTLWDCQRFVMTYVGTGPEVDKWRDDSVFAIKKHKKIESKRMKVFEGV